jgi:hypothetical protein
MNPIKQRLERWYVGVSIALGMFIPIIPAGLGHFGYDPILDVWYVSKQTDDPRQRIGETDRSGDMGNGLARAGGCAWCWADIEAAGLQITNSAGRVDPAKEEEKLTRSWITAHSDAARLRNFVLDLVSLSAATSFPNHFGPVGTCSVGGLVRDH